MQTQNVLLGRVFSRFSLFAFTRVNHVYTYMFLTLPLFDSSFQTPIDDIPFVMIPFQGRLLAGVGKALRIYDLGKKKLLRKAELKVNVYAAFTFFVTWRCN